MPKSVQLVLHAMPQGQAAVSRHADVLNATMALHLAVLAVQLTLLAFIPAVHQFVRGRAPSAGRAVRDQEQLRFVLILSGLTTGASILGLTAALIGYAISQGFGAWLSASVATVELALTSVVAWALFRLCSAYLRD